MLVVLCALIGSLTVLPAVLVEARRPGRPRARPVHRQAEAERPASHASGASSSTASCAAPCLAVVARRRPAARGARPTLSMHTKLPSFTDMPAQPADRADLQDVRRGLPGAPTPAEVVIRASTCARPQIAAAIRNLEQRAVATGADVPADPRHDQPRRHGRRRADPARRQRRRRSLAGRSSHAAVDVLPADGRPAARRRVRGRGDDRGDARLQRADEAPDALRDRLRARTRLRAPARRRSAPS